ncbi:MAG: hypothetical protein KA223_00790 [Candidatus Accumulibacter sp.]|jgi:hypothetical protein|nr:hypothetical protein [Accumulibacter sp.]
MFPRQVQPALDRWFAGKLTVPALLAETVREQHWNFPIELYLRAQRAPSACKPGCALQGRKTLLARDAGGLTRP